jgi:phosphoenolpyruvate-protein kinase (PTS system EI component)
MDSIENGTDHIENTESHCCSLVIAQQWPTSHSAILAFSHYITILTNDKNLKLFPSL